MAFSKSWAYYPSGRNYTLISPRTPPYQPQILGLVTFHNHFTQFQVIIVKIIIHIHMLGVCVISLVLATAKMWSDGQASVTALCYSLVLFRKQRKTHPGGVRVGWPKRCEEKGNPWPNFGSSFYVSFPPPGPALCKLGQSEMLFVLPEVLTLVLRPSFVLFWRAFPFFVF